MSAAYNYTTDGGATLVIGGKLTILPGAKVEGLGEGGAGAQIEAIPDSSATKIAELREEFNGLLAALRAAGIMKEA